MSGLSVEEGIGLDNAKERKSGGMEGGAKEGVEKKTGEGDRKAKVGESLISRFSNALCGHSSIIQRIRVLRFFVVRIM
jgi:hypothetical protein